MFSLQQLAKNPQFDIQQLLNNELGAAYKAPFPGKGHCAAVRAFCNMPVELFNNQNLCCEAKNFWLDTLSRC